MKVNDCYRSDLSQHQLNINVLSKKRHKIGGLRLLVFVLAFLSLLAQSYLIGFILFIVFISTFAALLRYDLSLKHQLDKEKAHVSLISYELHPEKCKGFIFDNGDRYKQANHAYANDLDILGKGSVFEQINRCFTRWGEKKLASWLLNPSDVASIKERQRTIEELSGKTNFRSELGVLGILKQHLNKTDDDKVWRSSDKTIKEMSKTRALTWFFTIINSSFLVLTIINPSMFVAFILSYFVTYYTVYYFNWKKFSSCFHNISKTEEEIKFYMGFLKVIENEEFESPMLTALQKEIKIDSKIAIRELRRLELLIKWTNYRLNMLFQPSFNAFFYIDIKCLLKIEKWKKRYGANYIKWQKAIGEIEALNSLANFHFKNEDWVFPKISSDFQFKAIGIGHPLIAPQRRKINNYNINQDKGVDLVTGSNMSGKSTFLRTLGVNVVLALAGSVVCCEYLELAPLRLMTYMRIEDSLLDGTSTFYAEIKRLKKILTESENDDYAFLLLDELLRGTNSYDKEKGTIAIVNKLLEENTVAIVATHDLNITNLIDDYPNRIRNFFFDIKVIDGKMNFDYILSPGVCQSANASLLLNEIGLKV